MFERVLARFVWECLKRALGWERVPGSRKNFLREWLPLGDPKYELKLFVFVMILWSLWTVRNKMSIQEGVSKGPS
jgi:hypothetical protein